jgi:dGTP triphosphohydrolase
MAEKTGHMLKALFEETMRILGSSRWGGDKAYVAAVIRDAPSMSVLFDFIKNTNYTDQTPAWRIVTDYVAGMTDLFAQRSYAQLFLPTPVV